MKLAGWWIFSAFNTRMKQFKKLVNTTNFMEMYICQTWLCRFWQFLTDFHVHVEYMNVPNLLMEWWHAYTLLVMENNNCVAIFAGAQMQFCFARFDSTTSTCQGNLLGTVNTAEDCCLPIPRGLRGGGYVTAGSEGCMSCMRFTGKVLARDARCMHNW